jgi:hypothetical protein
LDEIEKSNKVVSKVVPGRSGFLPRRGNFKDRRFTKRFSPYQYKSNKSAFLENRRGRKTVLPERSPEQGTEEISIGPADTCDNHTVSY